MRTSFGLMNPQSILNGLLMVSMVAVLSPIAPVDTATNNNLQIDIGSYIGDSGDNKVLASAIGKDYIYIAGQESATNIGFIQAIDKSTLLADWTLPPSTPMTDIVYNEANDDLITIDTEGDIIGFNGDGTFNFSNSVPAGTSGAEVRLDVGLDGTIAALNKGQIRVLDNTGQNIPNGIFTPAGGTVMDLAIDSSSQSIIVVGETQKDGGDCTDYRAGWMRSYGYDGTLKWTNYDWSGSLAGGPQNDCADAMPQRVSMGADGKLYMAAESAGGNSVFRWDPRDRSKNTDANGVEYQVKYDQFTDPFNMSDQHITYYGRYDAASGELEKNQFVLSRLTSGTGNTLKPREITADSSGNVYIAGIAFASFPDRADQSINSTPIGDYAGKDGWLFKAPADFASRELSTTFSIGTGASSELLTVAVRNNEVITGGWLDSGNMFTLNATQASNSGGQEGYYAAWNLEPGEVIDTDNDGIEDSIENAGPNGGDANNDGTLDSTQTNVASYRGGFYYTVESNGCNQLSGVSNTFEGSIGEFDENYGYPAGLVEFLVQCGGSTEIKIFWYGADTSRTDYTLRKYGPTTPGDISTVGYYDFPAVFGVETIDGQQVVTSTHTLTDGLLGDSTGVDGFILDPVGIALADTTDAPDTSSNDEQVTANLPTVLIRTGGFEIL